MSRDEDRKRRSELDLELAAVGELDTSSWRQEDRARAEAIAEENRALLASYDVSAFAKEVDARGRQARGSAVIQRRQGRRRRLVGAVPLFAGVAALLFVFLRPALPDDDVVRIKSGVSLLAARVTPRSVEPLFDGAEARAGDVVQLQIVGAPAAEPLVVVSLDGRGAVTLHFPTTPDARLGPKGELPSSFALDDAPLFERFFVVAGAAADPSSVLRSARSLAGRSDAMTASLPLEEATQRSLLLHKDVTP